MLSREITDAIEHELKACGLERRFGGIEALRIVQQQHGWVSDEHVVELAAWLGLSPAEVEGVATFYNLIFRRSVGRHVILVCDSISCWTVARARVLEALEKTLEIRCGQTTPDNRFTLLPTPCLGACEQAPALLIDGRLFGRIEPTRLNELLARFP